MIEITRAGLEDVDAVAPLFDAYRIFYGQDPDLARAHAFLSARLGAGESVLFVARADGEAVGFTQLYPTFSSTRTCRVFVLNDLFVTPAARGRSVADALMAEAEAFAAGAGAASLSLETAVTNHIAQALYERRGWTQEKGFLRYNLSVAPAASR
jgi:ribosomal protein S18 acetylase RimI-like enzyme